jgi:hypothetical protein
VTTTVIHILVTVNGTANFFICILLREQRTAVKLTGLPKTMDSKYQKLSLPQRLDQHFQAAKKL